MSVYLTVKAHLSPSWDLKCPEEDKEASNLGPGDRRAAEKGHPAPLMQGTVAFTSSFISRTKEIPRRVLGKGVTRSNLWVTSCNLLVFCVGVLGKKVDGEQLLANQIWACSWGHSKARILTLGCGERKCRLYCRGQGRSPGNLGSN